MKKIILLCSLFFCMQQVNAQWVYTWFLFNQENNNKQESISYEKNTITINDSESYLSTISKVEQARFNYFSTSDYQTNKQNVSFFNLLKNKLLYLNMSRPLGIEGNIEKEGISMNFDKNNFNLSHVNEYQCKTLINFIKQKHYINTFKINKVYIFDTKFKPVCKKYNELSWK